MSATSNLSVKGIRKETNSLGKVHVPSSKLWDAQTQRSLEHSFVPYAVMSRTLVSRVRALKHSTLEFPFRLDPIVQVIVFAQGSLSGVVALRA